jgi:hypothetical protein
MGIKEKIAGLGTKTLAIIAVMIVAVSAATVMYLSNTVTTTATVASPLQLTVVSANYLDGSGNPIGQDLDVSGTVDFANLKGGDSFQEVVRLQNLANNPIRAKTSVTCSDVLPIEAGATPLDCAQLSFELSGTWGGPVAVPCYDNSDYSTIPVGTAVYVTQDGFQNGQEWSFPVGHDSSETIKGTLASNVKGSLSCNALAEVI